MWERQLRGCGPISRCDVVTNSLVTKWTPMCAGAVLHRDSALSASCLEKTGMPWVSDELILLGTVLSQDGLCLVCVHTQGVTSTEPVTHRISNLIKAEIRT